MTTNILDLQFDLNTVTSEIVSKFVHSEHFSDGLYKIKCRSNAVKRMLYLVDRTHQYRTALGQLSYEDYLSLLDIIETYCTDLLLIDVTRLAKAYYLDLYRPLRITLNPTNDIVFTGGIMGSGSIIKITDSSGIEARFDFISRHENIVTYRSHQASKDIKITLGHYDQIMKYEEHSLQFMFGRSSQILVSIVNVKYAYI